MSETDPRAITEEQWEQMGALGKELRRFVVRRGHELALPLDKVGTSVLLLLVHTAEPRWGTLELRARLGQLLDVAFELRELGTLETLFGPALRLNEPDPIARQAPAPTHEIECTECGTVFAPLRCPAPDCQAEQTGFSVTTNRDVLL